MYKKGHIGFALALYAPILFVAVALFNELILATLGLLIVTKTARLPDIDWRVPLIAHRGITHTVWFCLLIGAFFGGVFSLFGPLYPEAPHFPALFGFLIGVVATGSHLLADMITPRGIRPLHPVSQRQYSLGLVKSSNTTANTLALVLGGGLVTTSILLSLSII